MKFRNQKSFMGHTISNVTNKPLLHKKGKQWIVVAVSALILAGFGGVVSTTTHADTTVTQPTTTKVATKPANNTAKATTPAPSTNNNTKPSSVKPATPKATQPSTKNIGQQATNLHVKLLSQAPITNSNQNVVAHGYWNYNNPSTNNTPVWNLYSDGTLKVSKNPNNHSNSDTTLATKSVPSSWAPENNLQNALNISTSNAKKVNTLSFSDVQAPSDGIRLCDDETWHYFPNLQTLDLRGLSLNHVTDGTAMFGGLNGLTNVIGLSTPNNFNASLLFVSDPKLKSIDLTNMSPISSSTGGMFAYDNNLTTITLGPNNSLTGSELFNGDGVAMPSNQATWTPLSGHNVTVGYGSNNNTLSKNNTWNVGNTPLQATDTIKYINSENGEPILCNSIHHAGNYAELTGTYGTNISDSMWTSSHWSDANMPAYCNATPFDKINTKYSDSRRNQDGTKNQLLYNGGTYTIQITPDPASSTVNYVDQDGHNKGSNTFWGDYIGANGAVKQTFGYTPKGLSGYYVINPNTQIQFNNGNQQVEVAKNINQTINYQWGNRSVGSYTVSGYPGQKETVTGQGLQPGWKPNNGAYGFINHDGTFYIQSNDSTNNDGVEPMTATDTINYQYNGHTIASQTFTGNNSITNYPNGTKTTGTTVQNTSFTISSTPNGLPAGYYVVNPNESFNYDGGTYPVAIKPIQKTDTINYMNGSHKVSSASFTGNEAIGTTSFTVSAPSNYSLSSGATTTFKYDGSTYPVSVVPNKVNNTIYYEGSNGYSYSSSSNVSGPYSASGSVSAPSGYHYINNGSGSFTYGSNGTSHKFDVAPNPASETINYIYNNGSKNFNEGSTVMSGYYNESGNANGTSGLSSGYQLVSQSHPFTYSNASINVNVEPLSASANVLYQYNGKTISSSEISGNDYHATDAGNNTFSINNYVAPNGYHITSDSGYLDLTSNVNIVHGRSSYNIPVTPNRDTDTVDYQANGSTLASQRFSGNDEHATSAGDNSFNVTANNDSNIPSGYELVNNDNNFGFDNGTHDVAIKPIPQQTPSVPSDNIQPAPYIPSMPTSVASSASYVESAPASVTSQPSSESKPTYYSHYRYAKVVTPLQLHTSKHFTRKNGVLTIKHPTSFKIMKIVHDHKYARYEVRYNHKNYFITANDHFTINNYVQKHDFKSHKHMMVKVITPLIEYKHARFNRKYAIKVFKKGAVLPVKKVMTIGKGEMTRFELTNDRYVTSNKLFVKVIK